MRKLIQQHSEQKVYGIFNTMNVQLSDMTDTWTAQYVASILTAGADIGNMVPNMLFSI